jgi:hypothetical protein
MGALDDGNYVGDSAMADTAGAFTDPVIQEAQDRFRLCEEWEAEAQKHWIDDFKFAVADPDNGFQWPNDIRRQRDIDERPCLTINRTRQHNLLVINNLRRSAPSIEYAASGNGATKESAQIYQDLARSIQYKSNAKEAYGLAIEHQVKAGLGYWLVTTDYEDSDSMDQEVFIEPIPDPLGVYLDPDIQQKDGSDAMFGFVFKNLPRDEFKKQYPKYIQYAGRTALGNGQGWLDEDHVRVARYYRRTEDKDELILYPIEDGTFPTAKKSKLTEDIWKELKDRPGARTREVISHKVEWFFIIGETVIKENVWPGKTIPIVRLPGEEHTVDGVKDRVGHTRALKDAQRLYNYWTSSAVEHVALQSKVPWIVAAEAIEGYEDMWGTANTENFAYLPFNARDENQQQLPPPTRLPPPVMPQAYIQGMQIAQNEMMLASGQNEAEFGQQTPERSGVAIQQRQEQSDNATFHFMESLSCAIRYTGRILLDVIPHIYDTNRVRQIMAEDGQEYEVSIDPNAAKAYQQRQAYQNQAIQHLFNPSVGKYDVRATEGPNFGTRREAAQAALMAIMTQAPQVTPIIADLLLSASDAPMTDEAAERLKRMVPPQALGQLPPQQIQALQHQIMMLTQKLAAAEAEALKHKYQMENKQGEATVDMYNAETQRIKVTGEQMNDAAALRQDVLSGAAKFYLDLNPPQLQSPQGQPQPQQQGPTP